MTSIRHLTDSLEQLAPPAYQEGYDNAGLLVGDSAAEAKGVLVSLDVTEAVVEEAVAKGCNLVVAHHPLIFRPLKKLTGATYVERTVVEAIRSGVAVYAAHTNLDHVAEGVNRRLSAVLGLEGVRILAPRKQTLRKLVSFVPVADTQRVLDALYEAGAGQVGHYRNCSFRSEGTGTFQPDQHANPYVGRAGVPEEVRENRIELLFPAHLENNVVRALRQSHPYEEVAYYLTALENDNQEVGAGMVGQLPEAMDERAFLLHLKAKLQLSCVRHTALLGRPVRTVAVGGGAGAFLLPDALRQGADALVTADLKYHDFFAAERAILVADVGHYESEVFTKNLLAEYLSEKFPNIAVVLSTTITNPVNYL
ncbi:MAG: Nif3-like dinuclear metal center hexameric protein [Ferruginibacter sp.]|nr:Nif3-like dinuclear metal center hexameric protein [Cytophagales bacterium]